MAGIILCSGDALVKTAMAVWGRRRHFLFLKCQSLGSALALTGQGPGASNVLQTVKQSDTVNNCLSKNAIAPAIRNIRSTLVFPEICLPQMSLTGAHNAGERGPWFLFAFPCRADLVHKH